MGIVKRSAAWNKEKTGSVVLSKLKEFTITQNNGNNDFSVRGWYNKENAYIFGSDFKTKEEARAFLEEIHSIL
jgi:hypothetical protein